MEIKGITITLYTKTQTGTDAFNAPVYEEISEDVENILVSPASETEITDTLSLYGRRAIYTLAIPKGDTHTWKGGRVAFFDREWNVIGDEIEGIEGLIPLSWNKKVRVEAIDE